MSDNLKKQDETLLILTLSFATLACVILIAVGFAYVAKHHNGCKGACQSNQPNVDNVPEVVHDIEKSN
jgi:hypothetical protein